MIQKLNMHKDILMWKSLEKLIKMLNATEYLMLSKSKCKKMDTGRIQKIYLVNISQFTLIRPYFKTFLIDQ